MNSTNVTTSMPHSNANHNSQQQLNGPRELNYVNSEYMRDRNAVASTASKVQSNSRLVMANAAPKFGQKRSLAHGNGADEGDIVGSHLRGSTTKNRRNARNFNPDKHKKSHSSQTKDGGSDDVAVVDDIDKSYARVDSDEMADGGDENNDSNKSNRHVESVMGQPTISAAKSNLSYMTSRIDHQKSTKQRNSHADAKQSQKGWSTGSNSGHKTNEDHLSFPRSSSIDADVPRSGSNRKSKSVATVTNPLSSSSLPSRLLLTSTINSMLAANSETTNDGNDHSRTRDNGSVLKSKNRNHFDSHKNYNNPDMGSIAGVQKPNVAYLKAVTTGTATMSSSSSSSSSQPSPSSEPRQMQSAINNHHLNSNNVIVDSFESPPTTTMELECVAGYDGGLPQHFMLEAYDSRTKKLRLNITSAFSDVPLFRIDLAGMLCSIQ